MTDTGRVEITLLPVSTGPVSIGSRVRIRDRDGEMEFRIVDASEVNACEGLISAVTPMAQALVGHSVGDRVMVDAPAGVRVVELLAVR